MSDEKRLREELRKRAIAPVRDSYGRTMRCDVCRRTWAEHLSEEHELDCVARPAKRPGQTFDASLRELGLPMLEASDATLGRRPVSAIKLEVRTERQMLQRVIPPGRPERDVPAEVVEDDEGNEVVISWRRLSDEEWDAALKAYEKALDEWRRTGGRVIAKGATIVEASFRLEGGGFAEAIWTGRAWVVTRAST